MDYKTKYRIIDFHAHPFVSDDTNICLYRKNVGKMDMPTTLELYREWGMEKMCGCVINVPNFSDWEGIKNLNDKALELKEQFGDFYIPGFHVSPKYVKESIVEIERMHKLGVNFIGELVPQKHIWGENFESKALSEILEVAEHYNMLVSIHANIGAIELIKRHKNLKIIGSHPGEYDLLKEHMRCMEASENYYLDISGTGIIRYGVFRHVIDNFGENRLLFGTDYPVCNPAVYIGGIAFDPTLSEREKQKIFFDNAAELLNIK